MNVDRCRESALFAVATALLAGGLVASSCASSKGARRANDADAAKESKAAADAESYGTDPMGIAQRWADDPPESGPKPARERMQSWNDVNVLRLSRREDGSYRAVLGPAESSETDAVVLVIERADGDWKVTGAEAGSTRYLWPEM